MKHRSAAYRRQCSTIPSRPSTLIAVLLVLTFGVVFGIAPVVRADELGADINDGRAVKTFAQRAPDPTITVTTNYDIAFEELTYINKVRAEAGVGPLTIDASLTETAMRRAAESAILYAHIRPDGSSFSTAYPSNMVPGGENLGEGGGTESPSFIVDGFMNSPGHRKNLLDPRWKSVGLGFVVHTCSAGYTRGVWIQNFSPTPSSGDCPKPANDTRTYTVRLEKGLHWRDNGMRMIDPIIDPSGDLVLPQGTSEQLLLSIYDRGGATLGGITWSSSDESVATVDANGMVTGRKSGSATITGRFDDFAVTKIVNVTTPVPTSTDPAINYVYRLYNRYSAEHFYTTDANEADDLQKKGWAYEGIGWNAPKTSGSPIYRIYNQWSGEHLYTTDKVEYDSRCHDGWTGEGVKLRSADATGVPAYRLYNPYEKGPAAHHYTTDANERATLLKQGWHDEKICWYGLE